MNTASKPAAAGRFLGVAAALAIVASLGTYAGSHSLFAQDKSDALPRIPQAEALKHAYGLSDAFKAASKAIEPSVVNIRSTQRPQATANRGQAPDVLPFDEDMLRRFFGGEIPEGFQMQPSPMPRERTGVLCDPVFDGRR